MSIHHSILNIYKKNISAFIAPSNFMKNKIVEYGWDEDKFSVIYNPYTASLEASENEKRSAIKDEYLLYFGRLSKEKGLSTLIEAIKISSRKLKLVGRGPEKENLEKLAKELGADVEFLGFKSGQELKDIIMKAKATVIPSIWYENMPLSLLEALNLGCPVIASNIGGMPEIIKEGKNGWLFRPGDESDLADKIKDLDKYEKKIMSEDVRKSVAHLSTKNNLDEVCAVYSKVIQK